MRGTVSSRWFDENEKPHLSDALVTNEKQFEKVVALASVHGEGKGRGERP
jgi:hypothetical protein